MTAGRGVSRLTHRHKHHTNPRGHAFKHKPTINPTAEGPFFGGGGGGSINNVNKIALIVIVPGISDSCLDIYAMVTSKTVLHRNTFVRVEQSRVNFALGKTYLVAMRLCIFTSDTFLFPKTYAQGTRRI